MTNLPRRKPEFVKAIGQCLNAHEGPIRFLSVAAYSDIARPLHLLRNIVDEFWFCDFGYFQEGTKRRSVAGAMAPWILLDHEDSARPGPIEFRTQKGGPLDRYGFPLNSTGRRRQYRHVDPVVHRYTFAGPNSDRQVQVNFRNGCGAFALHKEFADASLHVFMHRADNPLGEGGSLLAILGHHGTGSPIPERRNLHATLMQKLATPGIIISDGCCSSLVGTKIWNEGEEPEVFQHGEHTFTPIAELDPRRHRTFAWRVEPIRNFVDTNTPESLIVESR